MAVKQQNKIPNHNQIKVSQTNQSKYKPTNSQSKRKALYHKSAITQRVPKYPNNQSIANQLPTQTTNQFKPETATTIIKNNSQSATHKSKQASKYKQKSNLPTKHHTSNDSNANTQTSRTHKNQHKHKPQPQSTHLPTT